nr:DUF1905 domain-containing protein [Geodermatophilus normandii]
MTTTLEPRGPAAAIVLSDEQVAELGGGGKAFPVRITIGSVTVEGRVARMGGENLVGLSRERRTALGVETGDTVEVLVAFDGGQRTVECRRTWPRRWPRPACGTPSTGWRRATARSTCGR